MKGRILFLVTHLLGGGHLTRTTALARAGAAAGFETMLVSGGMPIAGIPSDGVAVRQLPPIKAEVGAFTTLLDASGEPATTELLYRRRTELAGFVGSFRPDVIVTELFPFGRRVLAEEFAGTLDAARALVPSPLVLASIRDILHPPSRPEKRDATHRLLAGFFDGVLVHSDPGLVPLDASWPVDDALRAQLHYTGYVDAGAGEIPPAEPAGNGEILVSGGSSAAALPLYRAALEAAGHDAMPWRILVGAGVAPGDTEALRRLAPANATVEPARPDFRTLLARSAVFVGLAGYNTVMDIVATGARAVLVPFETGGETEQRRRADVLAAHGWVRSVAETELTGETLGDAVARRRNDPRPNFAGIRRDGASETIAVIHRLLERRPAGRDVGR